MYKAKENIRKFGADPTQPEFIINRGDLVELKSVDIGVNNMIYARIESNGHSNQIILEVFEKYFDRVKF